MPRLLVLALPALLGLAAPAAAQSPTPPPDLADYIKRPEPDFAWKKADNHTTDAGKVITLHLVSQKWHGEVWEHDLQVFVPKGATPKPTMLVYNTGGRANPQNAILGIEIAKRVKAPIAILFGIPKQPLYGGKREDALIAETFVRFLETKDGTWPLLFPMAKSVVKSMDALQAFAKQEWQTDVTGFVITGGSKRGWTSWLTAASGDPRVKAIAPMVIDTLNFQKQMPLHVKSFGRYSEMIHDYEERQLLPLPDTADAKRLWAMVDPWVYREKLTLPKMLINGTNDPYWPQEALNQYWDDLRGEKHVLYVPNAGHGLRPEDQPNQKGTKVDPFPVKAINTLSAFTRHVIDGKPMPELTWKHGDSAGGPELLVESTAPAKAMRGWVAESDTRDFRKSKWTPIESKRESLQTKARLTVAPVPGKYQAIFGEVEYDLDGLPFSLSTQIRVLEPKK